MRVPFLAVIVVFSMIIAPLSYAQDANQIIKKDAEVKQPKVIIFDVNETLLDLTSMKQSVGDALGGRDDLLTLWFSTMLHYSSVETLSGQYHSFGEIGTASLMMVAKSHGIDMSYEDAKASIVTPLRSLPAHADVKPGLEILSNGNYEIVSLTNSSSEGVAAQFANAGLTDYFAKRYSIDTIKKYKPHPEAYKIVLDDLGIKPEEALMVAAHAWDIMGAKNAGLQTAFITRPGKTLYPLASKPDYIVNDLLELAALLTPSQQNLDK